MNGDHLEKVVSLPWFRMYSEFISDPVIQSLAFEDQRHFVAVLCLKCAGVLDRNITQTAKDRIIIRALGLDTPTADEAKRRLMEVGLIDKKWQPKAWDKRQFHSDHSTTRTRKHRKNKETGNGIETSQPRFGNAPEAEADTDTEKETKKESPPPPPFQKIVDLYHTTLPDSPRCVELSNARKGHIRQRWQESVKDNGDEALDFFRDYFERVAHSRFLTGKTAPSNSRPPFRATLMWLMTQENLLKVVEGKYDD